MKRKGFERTQNEPIEEDETLIIED